MVYRSFKSKKVVRSKITPMIGAAMSGHEFKPVIIYKPKKLFKHLIPPIDQSIISCKIYLKQEKNTWPHMAKFKGNKHD